MLNVRKAPVSLTGACITAALIFGGLAAPAHAVDTPSDVLQAVTKATPDTVANAASVATTSEGTNAIEFTVSGTTVNVPVDPAAGILLSSARGAASVGLPFATGAANAVVERPGVVSYDNGNGSRTVAAVQDDGSVQLNTVIENANAPTRYDYPITVPEGHKLVANEGGSVFAVNDAGAVSLFIAPPWAKDALGKSVPTRYEINGTTLTHIVDHPQTNGVTYPVVADPWMGEDLMHRAWIDIEPQGYTVNVDATRAGRIFSGPLTLWAHEAELRDKLGGNAWRVTPTIREQFFCHVVGNYFERNQYNMESWLPYKNWWEQLNPTDRCNPGSGHSYS